MRIRALVIRILKQFLRDRRTLALMILAPILMVANTKAVLQILRGQDAGWHAQQRDTDGLAFWDAFKSMRRPLVIDCVGVVDPRRTELDGVELVRMGHPGSER